MAADEQLDVSGARLCSAALHAGDEQRRRWVHRSSRNDAPVLGLRQGLAGELARAMSRQRRCRCGQSGRWCAVVSRWRSSLASYSGHGDAETRWEKDWKGSSSHCEASAVVGVIREAGIRRIGGAAELGVGGCAAQRRGKQGREEGESRRALRALYRSREGAEEATEEGVLQSSTAGH